MKKLILMTSLFAGSLNAVYTEIDYQSAHRYDNNIEITNQINAIKANYPDYNKLDIKRVLCLLSSIEYCLKDINIASEPTKRKIKAHFVEGLKQIVYYIFALIKNYNTKIAMPNVGNAQQIVWPESMDSFFEDINICLPEGDITLDDYDHVSDFGDAKVCYNIIKRFFPSKKENKGFKSYLKKKYGFQMNVFENEYNVAGLNLFQLLQLMLSVFNNAGKEYESSIKKAIKQEAKYAIAYSIAENILYKGGCYRGHCNRIALAIIGMTQINPDEKVWDAALKGAYDIPSESETEIESESEPETEPKQKPETETEPINALAQSNAFNRVRSIHQYDNMEITDQINAIKANYPDYNEIDINTILRLLSVIQFRLSDSNIDNEVVNDEAKSRFTMRAKQAIYYISALVENYNLKIDMLNMKNAQQIVWTDSTNESFPNSCTLLPDDGDIPFNNWDNMSNFGNFTDDSKRIVNNFWAYSGFGTYIRGENGFWTISFKNEYNVAGLNLFQLLQLMISIFNDKKNKYEGKIRQKITQEMIYAIIYNIIEDTIHKGGSYQEHCNRTALAIIGMTQIDPSEKVWETVLKKAYDISSESEMEIESESESEPETKNALAQSNVFNRVNVHQYNNIEIKNQINAIKANYPDYNEINIQKILKKLLFIENSINKKIAKCPLTTHLSRRIRQIIRYIFALVKNYNLKIDMLGIKNCKKISLPRNADKAGDITILFPNGDITFNNYDYVSNSGDSNENDSIVEKFFPFNCSMFYFKNEYNVAGLNLFQLLQLMISIFNDKKNKYEGKIRQKITQEMIYAIIYNIIEDTIGEGSYQEHCDRIALAIIRITQINSNERIWRAAYSISPDIEQKPKTEPETKPKTESESEPETRNASAQSNAFNRVDSTRNVSYKRNSNMVTLQQHTAKKAKIAKNIVYGITVAGANLAIHHLMNWLKQHFPWLPF